MNDSTSRSIFWPRFGTKTLLDGKGDRHPDAILKMLRSEDSGIFLTFHRSPKQRMVKLKSLAGLVPERTQHTVP